MQVYSIHTEANNSGVLPSGHPLNYWPHFILVHFCVPMGTHALQNDLPLTNFQFKGCIEITFEDCKSTKRLCHTKFLNLHVWVIAQDFEKNYFFFWCPHHFWYFSYVETYIEWKLKSIDKKYYIKAFLIRGDRRVRFWTIKFLNW